VTAMARFDLVIFDCDGVVVDSERIVHAVFADFIRSLGADLDAARMNELFLGRRLEDCLAIVEGMTGKPAPHDALDRYRARGDRGGRCHVHVPADARVARAAQRRLARQNNAAGHTPPQRAAVSQRAPFSVAASRAAASTSRCSATVCAMLRYASSSGTGPGDGAKLYAVGRSARLSAAQITGGSCARAAGTAAKEASSSPANCSAAKRRGRLNALVSQNRCKLMTS